MSNYTTYGLAALLTRWQMHAALSECELWLRKAL